MLSFLNHLVRAQPMDKIKHGSSSLPPSSSNLFQNTRFNIQQFLTLLPTLSTSEGQVQDKTRSREKKKKNYWRNNQENERQIDLETQSFGLMSIYIAEIRKLFSHRRLAFNFFSWMSNSTLMQLVSHNSLNYYQKIIIKTSAH